MMRLGRSASLLVAFSLLTSAATAYAECAWALWLRNDSSPWDVLQAFSSREGCIEAMSKQVAAVEKRNPGVTLDTVGGSFSASAKGRILRGQCLPDTLDPRGPKESGR
jgi:ABC-type glycerol-3-phosphate transport system substrate-binding protein